MGAKLGAIRGGLLRTAMDADGHDGLSFHAVWTAVDRYRRRLEIYGSEGCGFKSCRARKTKSLREQGFVARRAFCPGDYSLLEAILGSYWLPRAHSMRLAD